MVVSLRATFLAVVVSRISLRCALPVASTASGNAGVCSWARPYWNRYRIETANFCTAVSNANQEVSEEETEAENMPEKKPFQRLPTNVIPSNYKLKLQPDLQAFTFKGFEQIAVDVKQETKSIILNSADIKVNEAKYTFGGKDVSAEVSYQEDNETVTLTFPDNLQTGAGSLTLDFTGELNDKMKGFYRSKYTAPNGEQRFAAVTQFEATDARRAFPCWDEPAVKATFDVTLVVPKDKVALSNMPVTSDKPLEADAEWRVVDYGTTPIMSTYLLAFVVGEYDYVEGKDSDGVLIRVYTPLEKSEQGKFALEVAMKTLPFYKEYFGIAYPLPKMDLIAIADFSAGAMENWGLVTYRETALLIDPKQSSASTRQWVALVVGHELAHQWFGNLVTMEWWTHLWLNEGFASFIEYLCVNFVFPEYDIWTQFVSVDFMRALELDALKNSHPIEVPVGHPDEVDEIFDAISYSKGASVIRMLHDWIGDDDFKKGMNHYLEKFKYGNTFTEDLWDCLGKASGKPVEKVMNTWTKQMGFPVLKVSEKKEGKKRTLTITQEKFCADGQLEGKSPVWMVPVSISTASSPATAVKTVLIDSETTEVVLEGVAEEDWVKLNPGTVGFYRTQYSSEMLDSLLPGIKCQSLPPRDRLGVQNDLFALARAGVASSVDVLKVAEAFVNEDNYTVWNDLSSNLGQMALLLQHTDAYENYKNFNKALFRPTAKKVGWEPAENEGHLTAMLRTLVLTKLGRYGDEATVEEARKRLAAHVDGSKELIADLRSPVYTTVLAHGNEETFETMLKVFRSADMHEEKVRVLRTLGSVKSEQLIQRVLDFSLGDEVRAQDAPFVVGGVTGSVLGRKLAWDFMTSKSKELYERYQGGFLLARLVKFTSENFVDEKMAQEVESFFEKNPAAGAERTVQQSVENIRLNEKWLKREAKNVAEFLTSYA